MEENKLTNEEVTVNEEVKVEDNAVVEEASVVEEPKAEEPVIEETKAVEPAEEEPAAEETASEEPNLEGDVKDFADDIVNKIKDLVKEGNVTRIRIRKDDTIILNLPMTVGVIGTALGLVAAPWALIIGTISTIGFKCTVEVEKKDGTITVIHGKENK